MQNWAFFSINSHEVDVSVCLITHYRRTDTEGVGEVASSKWAWKTTRAMTSSSTCLVFNLLRQNSVVVVFLHVNTCLSCCCAARTYRLLPRTQPRDHTWQWLFQDESRYKKRESHITLQLSQRSSSWHRMGDICVAIWTRYLIVHCGTVDFQGFPSARLRHRHSSSSRAATRAGPEWWVSWIFSLVFMDRLDLQTESQF